MVKTKYQIGDVVYFMKYDTPAKAKIEGFTLTYGKFENSSFKKESETDKEPIITYSVGAYCTVDESKAFESKEKLIEFLFSNLD